MWQGTKARGIHDQVTSSQNSKLVHLESRPAGTGRFHRTAIDVWYMTVVHACITTEAAETEIPALLRGEAIKPASGYGTNTRGDGQPRNDISFIIVGGGYQPAELDKIKAVSDAVKPVPFFAADRAKNPAAPGPPPPEIIKQRILAKVDEADDGTGSWAPVIHQF